MNIRGEVIGRTDFRRDNKNFTVDTCFTNDTGMYETAIMYRVFVSVVETYSDAESAKVGHKKWCEFTRTEPISTVLFTIFDD